MDRLKTFDWHELIKHAGLVALAAVLTYATTWAAGQDLGAYGPLVTGLLAVGSGLVAKALLPGAEKKPDEKDPPGPTPLKPA